MQSKHVYIQINDVRIKIVADYPQFINYLKMHFNRVILPGVEGDCEMEIGVYWKKDLFGKNSPRLEDADISGLNLIGESTFQGSNRLVRIEKIQRRKSLLECEIKDKRFIFKVTRHQKVFIDAFRKDSKDS